MKRLLLATLLVLLPTLAQAQITVTYSFTAGTTILSSQVNANFAKFGDALNRTGGTMTGTLVSQQITPSANNTYGLGVTGTRFASAFITAITGSTINLSGTATLAAVTATTGDFSGAVNAVGFLTQGSTKVVIVGKQSVWIPATAMIPSVTSGANGPSNAELTSGQPNIAYVSFPAASDTSAEFAFALPKSWNLGTITFQPIWTGTTAGAGTTIWKMQCVGSEDNETIDAAFGTAISVTDTFLTAKYAHIGPESAALTVSGAAADSLTSCRIVRNGASDTRAQASFLLGIKLFYTTTGQNDN